MAETFVYDDPDGTFELTVGDEELEFRYQTNGDLNTLSLTHYPHDMEEFCEFLLGTARELQAELARQELLQAPVPPPRFL